MSQIIVIFDEDSDDHPLHDQYHQCDTKVSNENQADSLFPNPTDALVGLTN
jgi:hypothetical protein